MVLAQTAVNDHSDEITAIPELLRMLCLESCIVTLDAMGCQKAIARQIRTQEAGYVLRVRAHHQGLHERMEDTFRLERAADFVACPHDYADTVGKDHGLIETRRCWTTGDPAYLAHVDPDREWCDLASLVEVECERRCGDRVATDTRCFIPACLPRPSPCCRRCAGTGASRTPTTGSCLDAIALGAGPGRASESDHLPVVREGREEAVAVTVEASVHRSGPRV